MKSEAALLRESTQNPVLVLCWIGEELTMADRERKEMRENEYWVWAYLCGCGLVLSSGVGT